MKVKNNFIFSIMLLGLSLTACNMKAPKITGFLVDNDNNILLIYDNGSHLVIGNLNDQDIADYVDSITISDDGYYIINGIKTDIKATDVYTVKFKTGYSATVKDQKILKGNKVERPQLNRTGYNLDGWYCNGEEWRFNSDVVLNNMELTAKWTPKQYTISFDSDGGTPVDNMVVTYDSDYTLPTSSKDLYTLAGWKYGETIVDNSGTWSIDSDGEILLVADWARTTHKINFNTNGGDELSSMDIESYTSVNSLPTPTWEDHVFLGWTLNGESIELPINMEDSDITLVATWKGITDVFEFKDELDDTITITKFIGNETDVVVPEKIARKTVKAIAENAFENGSNIKNLILGPCLTNLDYKSLLGLNSIVSLTISGDAYGSLKYYFGNDEGNIPLSLTTITFAEGSTTYSKAIFDKLSDTRLFKVNLPASVMITPKEAFLKCSNIKEVFIPDGVIAISTQTFRECSNLEKINIPSTVKSLDFLCISYVPKLLYLIIPASVTKFYYSSLDASSTVIFFESTEKSQFDSSIFYLYNEKNEIYFGFEELKANNTFNYALCRVASVRQAIILSLVDGAKKPYPMPTELDGYPVVLSKV
ncbi:MAG: InlB B-repeat-containing protein [Bacilli bacterium]|nr:InlB B-repeat-containing protein [Bacilli bacterium]